MTKNMTTGSPTRHIISFTLPLLLGNLFQQFYSMVDTIIVGRTMGTQALGGVGSTGSITFLVLGFCMGLSTGFSIPVSQRFGAGDFKELRRFVGNTIWLLVIISVVFTVSTVVLCGWILRIMNTPEDIFNYAYDYLVVIFIGLPILMLYNTLSSMMRALGDSITPVVFLVVASFVNIGLDLLFILVFNMGTAGAAWATVISQFVSCIGCFVMIIKRFDVLHIGKEDIKFRSRYVKRLLAMGLPMGLQFSITAIGSVLLQTAINGLGSAYVSAVTAAAKISALFTCAYDSMGSTMATYGGQNIGAGRLDRIRKGLRACLVMCTAYSVIALTACALFSKPMIGMFLEQQDQQILELASEYLMINAYFFILVGFVNIFRLLIQGLGYAKLAICAGTLEMVGRGLVGVLFIPMFGFPAACFSAAAAWLLADIFLIPAYFSVMRRLSLSIPQKPDPDSKGEEDLTAESIPASVET